MLRKNLLPAFVLGAAVTLAACSEGVFAPKLSTMPEGALRPDIIIDYVSEDSLSADFTVTPTGGTFVLGRHAIHFPANSICDPAVSTYGPTEWDAPCTPLSTSIQIHAEIRHQDGFQWIDFTPSLRFVPTDDPYQYVWLYLKSDAAVGTETPSMYSILWTPQIGQQGIDEAATDPTQATYLWREGGVLFRRIKHFSGFQGADGYVGTEVDGLVISVSF